MKPNMCVINLCGGDNNCGCRGIASKCRFGVSRPSQKYCKFVLFSQTAVDTCTNKEARLELHRRKKK
jgi:hypothetical protein